MADYVETLGITDLIRKAGYDPSGNFEAIYSSIHKAGLESVLTDIDAATRTYFTALQLPDEATVYDYLVLSLRSKDVIVTFNWDPLLIQAYKRWRHLGDVLPQMVFLHGNVDLGVDRQAKVFGFLTDEPYPGQQLVPTPLLYPIDKKDYQVDSFVAEQWRRATDGIGEAYYISIFGYSAPSTDVEARSLLLTAWQNNTTHRLARIAYIDIRNAVEVQNAWADFNVSSLHGGVVPSLDQSILMRHPRRSCEAFAFATLQQNPWQEDPLPLIRSRDELEAWIKPLVEEEANGKLMGKPFH